MAITLDGTTGVTAAEFDGALDASNLTGTLPAIDGSALTNLPLNGLGVDQTPQAFSRSYAGTSYQNTTGKPIFVSAMQNNRNNSRMEVSSNNSSWITTAAGDGGARSTRSAVVPNGWYYRYGAVSSTDEFWTEVR